MAEILVLGTADWHQAIATNQHYAVRELAREHSVTFVQSMGLRTPELKMRDISRIARRLTRGIGRGAGASRRDIPPGVEVVSPRVVPRHKGVTRRVNSVLLGRQFAAWSESRAPKALWLYTPLDYGFAAHADVVVYHCVDLLATVPGIDPDVILAGERHLASLGTVVAAGSSPAVVDHLRSVGFPDPLYWPNVADTSVFATSGHSGVQRRPAAVFSGNMTTTKVDFSLLEDLVAHGVDLHLAGPVAEGGGAAQKEVDALVAAGATYHGLLSLSELARLQAGCSVGVIPYVSNEYTAGVSPLKTYEYLASGLAVVSTGVPSVVARVGHVDTASADQFTQVTLDALASTVDATAVSERLAIASQHSWTARGSDMRAVLARRLTGGAVRQC